MECVNVRPGRPVVKALLLAFAIFAGNVLTANAKTLPAPGNSVFKTYMSYKTITCETSEQYRLQKLCTTDDNGLRKYDDYYVIALGTYYTDKVGTRVNVSLDTGAVLQCVVGDIKADIHTDETNRQIACNGNVVEFIVDMDRLDERVALSGDVSKLEGFSGNVLSITVYETVNDIIEAGDKGFVEMTVTAKQAIPVGDSFVYMLVAGTLDHPVSLFVAETEYHDAIIGKTVVIYDKETLSFKLK